MQIGFPGLLGLMLIGLKLAGAIDWPWLWVLSPFWIGMAFGLAIVMAAIAAQAKGRRPR